jgi:uncharacterized membrane protein YfcA
MRTLFLTGLIGLAFGSTNYPNAPNVCSSDLDCYTEFEYCNRELKCEHRPLLPFRSLEVGGFVLFTLASFFANFSGIAGALPLATIVTMQKFNMKVAIMLSNAQITSGGIFRLAMDQHRKHPLRKTHGTLLDFPILTMMLPMITIGSALASIVSRATPDFFIIVLYAVFLAGILVFNIWRVHGMIKRENAPPPEPQSAPPILESPRKSL